MADKSRYLYYTVYTYIVIIYSTNPALGLHKTLVHHNDHTIITLNSLHHIQFHKNVYYLTLLHIVHSQYVSSHRISFHCTAIDDVTVSTLRFFQVIRLYMFG